MLEKVSGLSDEAVLVDFSLGQEAVAVSVDDEVDAFDTVEHIFGGISGFIINAQMAEHDDRRCRGHEHRWCEESQD